MDKDTGSNSESPDKAGSFAGSEASTIDFYKPNSLVGESLDGRFVIEKDLTDNGADAGGIGVVYLAKDTKLLGRQVVVKILQEAALKHADIVRKFLHEKEALIRLDHPGIVRILDSGTLTDGNPFMVMDFIHGCSLRRKLSLTKRLPLNEAAHILESATDALAAAHAEQILHRDIKPENIMLTPCDDSFDRVRLIDFGIARVGESKLAPGTEISRAIGTILYIAPEQLLGHLDLTPAVDIYATAIVAYEMLTGQLPFDPKTIGQMPLMQKEGVQVSPRQLRRDLPPDAEALIMSALEYDAEKRPQNARSFGRDLANALRREFAAGPTASADEAIDLSALKTLPIPAAAPTDHTTVTRLVDPTAHPKPGRFLKLAGIAFLILTALAVPAGIAVWQLTPSTALPANTAKDTLPASIDTSSGEAATVPAGMAESAAKGPDRILTYFLLVQKMRDGKPFEEKFKSSGQEIFEPGYEFNLNFQPDADGFMYVFNEGKDKQGSALFSLLFPTPKLNAGSSAVSANKDIQTNPNKFDGGRGTEIIWIIWTREKREDLEAIRQAAFDSAGSIIDKTRLDSLTNFLEKHKAKTPEVTKDSANQRTVVKTSGDVVVHRFELEHR